MRPLPTVAIGLVGGFIVGMTSVGSGSLMIVLLLFLYPVIGANQLVGTDLTQAVPLTLAAALGALAFGHVEFAVTTSIVIGSVPAVLVGSLDFFAGAGPLHPPGHHVRDLRLGPQVRRASARPRSGWTSAPCSWPPASSGSPTSGRGGPGWARPSRWTRAARRARHDRSRSRRTLAAVDAAAAVNDLHRTPGVHPGRRDRYGMW